MRETSSLLTRRGARAPGTSTAPITRSASSSSRSTRRRWTPRCARARRTRSRCPAAAAWTRRARRRRRACRRRSRRRAVRRRRRRAPRPSRRRRPGTPPSSTPEPPSFFIRWYAPTCVDSRPATSLIGASSGSDPSGSCTVSYAIDVVPAASSASVRRAVGREVQVGEQQRSSRRYPYSDATGSLTLQTRSALPHTSAASATTCAPAAANCSSVIAEPAPGTGLDQHLVTGADELVHARGRERHAVLVVLDLAGDADLHGGLRPG